MDNNDPQPREQSETITVTLPRLEDYAEDLARASRLGQAMTLAGELTPAEFEQWMAHGEAIKQRR